MISTSANVREKVWTQKPKYDLAEKQYYEKLAQLALNSQAKPQEPEKKLAAPEPVKAPEVVPKAPHAKEEKVQEQSKKAAQNVPDVKNQKEVKSTQESEKPKGFQNGTKKESKNKHNTDLSSAKNKEPPCTDISPVLVKLKDPPPPAVFTPEENTVEFELTIKCNSKKPKKVKKDRKRDQKNKNNENQNENNTLVANNNATNNAKKGAPQSVNTLAGEVAKAREHIKNSMQCIDNVTSMTSNLANTGDANKLQQLQKEHNQLKQKVTDMSQIIVKLEQRLAIVEKEISTKTASKASQHSPMPSKPQAPKPKVDDDDDGVDLFGSDSEEEDTEAAKIKEQRLAEYAAKKSKKPVLIAKSNIILDVKPWSDETDMKKMEAEVRQIATDGLVWGASKLVPLAYGIHKLQISCVVEDEKVSVDWLQETIEEIEDHVQSVDIAAFNKV